MDIQKIKELALANGFKLKEQADGSMDLNAYVYDFANAIEQAAKAHEAEKLKGCVVDTQKLTKEQAVIITGFTGILCGSFSDFHADLEKRLGRGVQTFEMGMKSFMADIKKLYEADFIEIATVCNQEEKAQAQAVMESLQMKDSNREAFEAWFESRYDAHFMQFALDLDMYVDKHTQTSWEAWQAAKAQAVPEGFVLVPMVPSERMINAVRKCYEGEAYLPYSLYSEFVNQAIIERMEAQEPAND